MEPLQTTRRLMLLRHGKAMRGRPGEGDFDRGLEPRGAEDAARIGRYLVQHDLVPDRVLASPAARARDTVAHLAAACPAAPAPDFDQRLYEARPETILDVVQETTAADRLLVVGHNPGLHELAAALIASGDIETREQLNEHLPTAGLVVIGFAAESWARLHPQSGRLELFVAPRMLGAAVD